ncbi:unnamed protein product [Caenorhabditis bovis]|uniref:Suppressor of white apricot N-terminal domain-containing protein n=1 Tax=Caenorhabditis bovis TaxID=2654633 RepID=A0A8S1ECB1_9PELO|nr:unnamed protein product [Caenorhabditis bovis]
MWHEARKQEKLLRAVMVDQSKRAERKRKYFENVRKDPEQFMQVHGRKSVIHADRNIAKAAEDSNILRSWQGDPSITIDRFDARSHLSKMDLMEDDEIVVNRKNEESVTDDKEELVCEFERFRVLVINSYKGVSEKSYLRKIAEREFWLETNESARKAEIEKKKKVAETKSSIGFSYDNSEVVKGRENADEDSDDEPAEPEDIDIEIDVNSMNAEAQRRINKNGEEFGVKRGLFCALLRADVQAQRDAAQLKQIDRQKAQLSGRESKHERMLLRRQRTAIVGKGCQEGNDGATATLLGFINSSSKKKSLDRLSSDSEDSGDEKATPEFITTFGGDEEKESDNDEVKSCVGPELPSEQYRKILELSKKRNNEDTVDWGDAKIQRNVAGLGRVINGDDLVREVVLGIVEDVRFHTIEIGGIRGLLQDIDDQEAANDVGKNGKDLTAGAEIRIDRRIGSHRARRDHLIGSVVQVRKSKPLNPTMIIESRIFRKLSEKEITQKISDKSSTSDDSSDEKDNDIKMLEIRSSMSESEKERIQIENRKRRIKMTKKMVKEKRKPASNSTSDDEEDRKAELARKKRQKMLKKTRRDMEREEEEKRRKADIEKRVRDEIRFIEEQERLEREREKRRKEERNKKEK